MSDLKVFYNDEISSNNYRTTTLCYLRRTNPQGETEYLLGKHYKQGKWNGFGGKVGDKPEFKDESIEESLVREGLEEFGVTVLNPEKRGIILFIFYDDLGQENRVRCHVFFADEFEGEITASTEMLEPTWFTAENMPWDEMWPNDKIWLEDVFISKQFLEAEFKFDPNKGLIASETQMIWKDFPTTAFETED